MIIYYTRSLGGMAMDSIKKIICAFTVLVAISFAYTGVVKAATVEITTETLNLRAEASTDSDIVAQISIGDECELLEEEGDWYRVKYGEYTGYISKEYANVVGQEDTSDTSDSNNDNGNNVNETTNENENTTSESESNSGNETTEGSEQNTTDEQPADAESSSQTGNEQEGTTSEMQNQVATVNGRTPIRIVPLINGSIIENLRANTEVTIINEINGWAYVQTDTISGWVRTDALTIKEASGENSSENEPNDATDNKETETSDEKSTSEFEERTMYATDYVNVRKEASSEAEVLMLVEPNTSFKVIGETGDWYEVETSQGNAFISKDLLSENQTTTNRGNVTRTSNENSSKTEKTSSSSKSESSNSSSSVKASEVVSYAKKFLGVPYVYGGASPSGFDCSGFTMYVFDHFGISMRHGAQAQAKLGKTVSANKNSKSSLLNNLKAGDLVFFLDYETMDEIGHCGIYIGNGNFIHASSGSGYCVKINSLLPGEYYNTRYCAARRVL